MYTEPEVGIQRRDAATPARVAEASKQYWMPETMYKRLKSPLTAQIEVTGACTNACQHCYNFWRAGGAPQTALGTTPLSVEDARAIVGKLGEAQVFSITLSGGEPLLNIRASVACIEDARARNIGVSMNSNMDLLTPSLATVLRRAGLRHILTSILGPTPATHDQLTQRQGSFNRLVGAIKNAQDADISVSANMVVSRLNVHLVRSTGETAQQLGIKRFSATKAGRPGNCGDFSALELTGDEVVRMLNDLCGLHKDLGLDVDTLEPIPVCGMTGVERPEFFISRKCCAGIATITVGADGSVRPCSHLDVSYGNLITDDLSAIWGRMVPFARGEYAPPVCCECGLLRTCGAGCRMEAKMYSGNIGSLDPYASPASALAMQSALRQSKQRQPISGDFRFRTRTLQMRNEEFGGVVASDKNARAFLDRVGYSVVSQFRPETEYMVSDDRIDWNGLDPVRFVQGLVARNVVTLLR